MKEIPVAFRCTQDPHPAPKKHSFENANPATIRRPESPVLRTLQLKVRRRIGLILRRVKLHARVVSRYVLSPSAR